MKPLQGSRERDTYIEAVAGLEQMAHLYKALEGEHRSTALDVKIARLFTLLWNRDLKGIKHRIEYRLYKLEEKLNRPNDPADLWKRNPERYFSNERIAVYTACLNDYDTVLDPMISPDNIDYYLITDRHSSIQGNNQTKSKWKMIEADAVIPAEFLSDPRIANRWCKMHPHILFPNHQISIYVDACVLIVSDFTALTRTLDHYPVSMFLHGQRDCVYDEVRSCIINERDSEEHLRRHKSILEAHHVPEKYGLLEAPVIVRRHMDAKCSSLMETWWEYYLTGSRRDQISLIDALWKHHIDPAEVGTLGRDFHECDLFIRMEHSSKTKK